jgi:MFS family permease
MSETGAVRAGIGTAMGVQRVAIAKRDPSFAARWSVIGAMSIATFGSYYAFDAIGPLAPVLTRQLGFSDAQIGLLQASYSLPNIFVLLAAGIIIDRFGAKKSMLAFGSLVFAGVVVTALTPQIAVMASGRLILGIGAESLAMATHVVIARWFFRSELTFAFALRGSALRLGSLSAQTSPTWAAAAYAYWRWPLLIAVACGSLCVIGTALYWVLESVGERRFQLGPAQHEGRPALRNFFRFNASFWLLAALCLTFYACIFPFQTFGQKFLINTHGLAPGTASLLIGMEPLFSLVLMPVFGRFVDRHGHRALVMTVGSSLLVPVFLLLAYTSVPPVIPLAMMGVAFSLVPAVLWMSVVFVVDRSRLGFASAVVDAVQQLGLVGTNLLIGWSNDHWLAGAANPAGYRPGMWTFTAFACLAVVCAAVLRRVETGPRGHGLETLTAGS